MLKQGKIHGKYDAVGRKIRAARVAAGLSQHQLAAKINAAVSSVQRWEHGECAPRVSSLHAIARICAVPAAGLTSAIKSKTKTAGNGADQAKVETAKRLRFLRGQLLLKDFAKKIGMTTNVYRCYERGQRGLRDVLIRNICVTCGVSADWLLFGKKGRRA